MCVCLQASVPTPLTTVAETVSTTVSPTMALDRLIPEIGREFK